QKIQKLELRWREFGHLLMLSQTCAAPERKMLLRWVEHKATPPLFQSLFAVYMQLGAEREMLTLIRRMFSQKANLTKKLHRLLKQRIPEEFCPLIWRKSQRLLSIKQLFLQVPLFCRQRWRCAKRKLRALSREREKDFPMCAYVLKP
ncbi:MAG: hypothetical protein AAGJ35_09080, partial [Myxococcota bacterium]